jgi:hypothetical protein
MKTQCKYIIKLLLGLIFPYAFYLIFIDKTIYNYNYYLIIILYLIFWGFPIIYYRESKKDILSMVIILNIILFSIITYFANKTSDELNINTRTKEFDVQRILNYQDNKDFLLKKNIITATDIEEFNKKYNDEFFQNKCHYIGLIDN